MSLNRFIWRRAFPSVLLVGTFVVLYEATVSDSRYAARQAELIRGEVKPIPGTRLLFKATAYCKGQTTASGVAVRSGVAAADPDYLPVGSVIQADFEQKDYDGVYTIMDTGPDVQGREVDVYMWSCFEALRFGRQDVHIVVLRLGWNPKDTTPLIGALFPGRVPPSKATFDNDEPDRSPRSSRTPSIPVVPIPNPTFEKATELPPDSPQP
jgi:3D (Asp-Asp-Asp) domain-containing protein